MWNLITEQGIQSTRNVKMGTKGVIQKLCFLYFQFYVHDLRLLLPFTKKDWFPTSQQSSDGSIRIKFLYPRYHFDVQG